MRRNGLGWIVALCAVVAVLAAIASAAGVFLRGDLATTAIVTPRGEHVDMLTGGIYRWNGKNIASEGVGWDFVTLFLVVPSFVVTLPFLRRGSRRAALVATGLLAYFLYQYLEYAVFLAYGQLFLLYVATFSLSLTAIVLLVAAIDLGDLAAHAVAFPRRGMIGVGLWMAGLLLFLWLPLIARTFNGDVQDVLDGGSTLVVQAFDLGLLVPLGLFTAATVHRRMAVGYLLSAVVVVKAVAMPVAICAMLVFEAIATGELQLPPIIVFALTAAASLLVGIRVYGAFRPAVAVAPRRLEPAR